MFIEVVDAHGHAFGESQQARNLAPRWQRVAINSCAIERPSRKIVKTLRKRSAKTRFQTRMFQHKMQDLRQAIADSFEEVTFELPNHPRGRARKCGPHYTTAQIFQKQSVIQIP